MIITQESGFYPDRLIISEPDVLPAMAMYHGICREGEVAANNVVLHDDDNLAVGLPLHDPGMGITTGGGQQGRPLAGGGGCNLTDCATVGFPARPISDITGGVLSVLWEPDMVRAQTGFIRPFLALLVLLLPAACGEGASPSPTITPDALSPEPTSTPEPTATPTPIPTPTPEPPRAVAAAPRYCSR